ncbi:MAG: tetratricopeptide repeat protein [Hyphomicrobium sp.]|jgi:Flp pilus assembly protein TadD
MAFATHRHSARRLRQGGTIAALTASLLLGACGQTLGSGGDHLALIGNERPAQTRGQRPDPAQVAQTAAPATTGGISEDLLKATDYWGQIYAKAPRELDPALNYARNLKAMGEKRRALAVLQQASLYHGESRELASEYGRLALDLDQVGVAKKLLAIADDPARPDWRVISARGAALAKEGNYNEAIPFFQHALALAPDQPSVMSNIALAYAMNGEPSRAESMLRQAAAGDTGSQRIRQNLALVLGLQGKYDEATLVAARDMPISNATENSDYLRQVVKLDPKSVPGATPETWDTQSKLAEAPVSRAVPVEKVTHLSAGPEPDHAAANDAGWVVSIPEPAPEGESGSAPVAAQSKLMSVADMAKKFAIADAETPNETKARTSPAIGESWTSQLAQTKR